MEIEQQRKRPRVRKRIAPPHIPSRDLEIVKSFKKPDVERPHEPKYTLEMPAMISAPLDINQDHPALLDWRILVAVTLTGLLLLFL